jgi:hypothetical protein
MATAQPRTLAIPERNLLTKVSVLHPNKEGSGFDTAFC